MSTISIILFTIAGTLFIPALIVVLIMGSIRVYQLLESCGERGFAWTAIGLWALWIIFMIMLGFCWMDGFPEIHPH